MVQLLDTIVPPHTIKVSEYIKFTVALLGNSLTSSLHLLPWFWLLSKEQRIHFFAVFLREGVNRGLNNSIDFYFKTERL